MVLAHVDETAVAVAAITAVPSLLAALASFRVHRQIRTPSGETLGGLAERTHDLVSVGTHRSLQIARSLQAEDVDVQDEERRESGPQP